MLTMTPRYACMNLCNAGSMITKEGGRLDAAMNPAKLSASSQALRSSRRMKSTASPTTKKITG